jgi:hypothetical protein
MAQGVFGMNVGGLSSNNASWSLFWTVTAPGTLFFVTVILSGKWWWPKRPKNPVSAVATEAKRFAFTEVEDWKLKRSRRNRSIGVEELIV